MLHGRGYYVGVFPVSAFDLAALSEAATKALKRAMALADAECDGETMREARHENTAAHDRFAYALVNAYRSGDLVLIDREGMREEVAKALAEESGSFPSDDWRHYTSRADAAIAAILGEG